MIKTPRSFLKYLTCFSLENIPQLITPVVAVVELHENAVSGVSGWNINASVSAVTRRRDGAESGFTVEVFQVESRPEWNVAINAARHQSELLIRICIDVIGNADTHILVQVGFDNVLTAECNLLD